MITVDNALEYMGIDYADTVVRNNVTRALNAAESTLKGAVGDDILEYLGDDPRVDELLCVYTDDLYSERGVSQKVSGATRRLVQSMELQLRCELARLKAGECCDL